MSTLDNVPPSNTQPLDSSSPNVPISQTRETQDTMSPSSTAKTVTSETVTSETVTSETVTSETVTSETVTAETVASQILTPQILASWCDTYLQTNGFKDYCPNGLQVDADTPIKKIITGVTASQNLIDAAVETNADAILVHHGYFWKGESAPLTGIKGKRIRTLLQNNISLLAYHLPLDAHPLIGNNAVLAAQLGLSIIGPLYPEQAHPVGNIAHCTPQTIAELIKKVTQVLARTPLHIAPHHEDASQQISTIGLCTGGAQDMIAQAAKMGCEVYISGEISERTTHLARELGIHYLACGHHATEMGGIMALGDLIAQTYAVEVRFIDDSNPV